MPSWISFYCVKEDTVSKECEDDEVDGGEHATPNASLRLDAVVHHSVPVLAGQNLGKTGTKGVNKLVQISQTAELNDFMKGRD